MSAWVRVTLMGSEEMVVVQGQVIDVEDVPLHDNHIQRVSAGDKGQL